MRRGGEIEEDRLQRGGEGGRRRRVGRVLQRARPDWLKRRRHGPRGHADAPEPHAAPLLCRPVIDRVKGDDVPLEFHDLLAEDMQDRLQES